MADRDPQPFTADPAGYETDTYAWTKAQVELLKARRFSEIDLENVIEEIDSLGNEQAHAIGSHLMRVIEHLLKLQYSADFDPRNGWRATVNRHRAEIDSRLEMNPSLRRRLPEFFDSEWSRGRRLAKDGLREAEQSLIPTDPPFTLAQALDWDFFPAP